MKKTGSILIEVVASSMILTLTTTFAVSSYIQSSNVLKYRILHEEVERSVCNLIKEFKYNVPMEDIEIMMNTDGIGFKYDRDFSEKLIYVPVKELQQGTDIRVKKVSEDGIGIKLKIIANIETTYNSVLVEKEFTKSWWMDEV